MYHHHSQQQGSQPFSNGPRPPHHQPPPNQHQNRTPSDMLSQVMGFQFPRPTQLPDELESALSIRGAREMDNRLTDHINRPNQHQNQNSGSVISQHGNYGSNPVTGTSDNQPAHQQGIDWSSYQPPTKLFASPSPSVSHQTQQQQPKSSQVGTNIPSWTASASDSPLPQARQPLGGRSVGSGDGQGLYTPESAGSILASFGLSNEDLEVLSHYPDDQLTPDTLPFILRDIQINKSGNKKTVASSSSFSHSIHDMPLPPNLSSPLARSRSPEVPSLLTVTQTAGKVIDYGHASRAKDECSTRETFKREQLTSERTVKMYPSSSSSSSSAQKTDKAEGRQVRLEHTESSKHGDRDYRRTSSDHRKSNRSPGREFPPSSKSHNQDRDYRRDGPKPRPSSETRSDTSSKRSLSSSSGSKLHSSSKKLPTPTMISDFSATSPKVYPHTCSLCHIQCDQEKDWVEHINTVNHTAACRDLRNKYPDWKPNLPSRSRRYGSQALWDPKDRSPSHSVSRSLSCSPTPSPPHSKHRVDPPLHRPHGRPYAPRHHPRHQHYTEHSHSGSHQTSSSSREHCTVKRDRESSGCSSHSDVKHLQDDSSRRPFSSKAGHSSKHGPLQSSRIVRSGTKPGTKMNKMAGAKATDTTAKPPPSKKKKKVVTPSSQDSSFADRLVYVTGIPKDASEQDVTDLVGSFGKINNVVLMPCSEEESERAEGQKASVCMVKAEDAQALANSTSLTIRDQQINTSIAKKPGAGQSLDMSSKPAPGLDKGAVGEGGEADQKPADKKGLVLITGLPESDWSESDIIELIQSFGTPSDIILATQIGKVLVSVPDPEIAQEIVKVHSFIPMKIKDSELKVTHLKQYMGLSTPVALYNLLMGSLEPLESAVPVSWSSLLVISNVPNTASGFSEVQKLVRRFGTVIKTLVLNSMVICEMATAAMALSVYKRFQKFPCIIQNNPLFFSRKPDPKASTPTKVIAAYIDPSEDTPANGKGCQMATAADEEQAAHKEDSQCPLEGMEKDVNGRDEKMKSTGKTTGEDEALGENKSKGNNITKDGFTNTASESLAAPNTEVQDLESKTSVVETVMETAEEKKCGNASKAENDRTPAGEETKPPTSDDTAASQQVAVPELPKVTHEMVKALLEECRTRTASHPGNLTAPTQEEQGETQMETEQGVKAAETREPATQRKHMEVEKERQAREKERRAKRERERNERARREREKSEEDRRERERRDRKRASNESSSARSSCRLEGYKQSSWREEAGSKAVEEEFDEFPFNMSDFVTVDEVGDVADLPCSPSPTVPLETTEGGQDTPISVQKDSVEDADMEVTAETRMSHATVTLVKSDEVSAVCTVTGSDGLVSSHLTPGLVRTFAASPAPASQSDTSLSQTPVLTCQPEAPETADAGTGELTAESEEAEREHSALQHSQAKEEQAVVSDHEKMHDEVDKEPVAPAAETGKHKRSEDQADTEEESVRKRLKMQTPLSSDYSLPPFTPSNPVGMEFLVPKTGFFCKVCNRFYSGTKEAEITHCKTLKHYENLQKFLQTMNKANVTTKD